MYTLNKTPKIVWMYIGILLYEISNILSFSFSEANYVKMLGVVISTLAFCAAPKRPVPSSIKFAFSIFIVLFISMLFRGSLIGRIPLGTDGSLYEIIRHFLVYKHSAFSIMFPLVIMVDFQSNELKYYKKLTFASCFVSLGLLLFYSDYIFNTESIRGLSELEINGEFVSIRNLSHSIFVGLGFILCIGFSYSYLHSKLALLIPTTLLLYFITQVMGGGRGGSVMAFGYILLFFILACKSSKIRGKVRNSIGNRFPVLLFLFFFIFFVVYLFQKTDVFEFLIFRTFNESEIGTGLKDSSREIFVDALIDDFNNHPLCWLFGRGVNGTYSLPNGEMRSALEWGYLWLVLKGGIIYFLLYTILLIKPAFIGLFHSNNQLSKAFAVMCIIQLLSLIPFGVPAVTTMFLLTWHGVRLLTEPEFTSLSDQEIDKMIN